MNLSALKSKTGVLILLAVLAAGAIYALNLFPLAYKLTAWKQFGNLPIQPTHLVYFEADTPNVIGYREPSNGETVTCVEAVAYLETSPASGLTRCCQAETKVSCLAGDFSAEVPPADEPCAQAMRAAFGVTDESIQVFGECPEDGIPQMTAAQMDGQGNIRWKAISMYGVGVLSTVLRCVLSPLLLALALRASVLLVRKADPSRQMRRW